jgi:uncharacterized protein (DUF362 family)
LVSAPRVAIVDDSTLTAAEKLSAALDGVEFWDALARARAGRPADELRIVIKPELAGFAAGSPSVTDPVLVEALLDLLHDRGFSNASVVGTPDSSALWADNRELYALSDLLGYRFATPQGRSYDIVDLSESPDGVAFASESVLHGDALSRDWIGADIRIVFSKNRTDEQAGYALCLDTLIGVLPRTDKDLHYRSRRDPGDVVADLLTAAPITFCLIDAIVSAHGSGGGRAPLAIESGTVVAASDIVLADYIGALKMGLDPSASPIFARVVRTHRLPRSYTISGTLTPYAGWLNVPAPLVRAAQMRGAAAFPDRLVAPWLQRLDPELFPLKHPVDAKLNAALSEFFADTATSAGKQWLLAALNLLLGLIGQWTASYQTLVDKDALRQRALPLGIDVAGVSEDAFDDLVADLIQLEPIAAQAPKVSDELSWRYVEEAVVFHYTRTLPIDYARFVQRVDVARTIQFMNDYLGGVVVPLARDEIGRPVRQAERNIYLPQPNYLVLYQGKPIDVSKLEVVEYDADRHRLYWKTIDSQNDSAIHDDGIATFERVADGTRITIIGRQQFTLPLFWQVFDLNLVPDLKSILVTHAYRTFFDRTIANFEALVEGREIRIGRPVDEPALPAIEQLMPLLRKIGDVMMPLLQNLAPKQGRISEQQADADGFVHVVPGTQASGGSANIDGWTTAVAQFLGGLGGAVQRDVLRTTGLQ